MWRNWTELYGILIWASWVRFPDEKKKKTGIIHKQSLKGDDTRNLTFCDYYCFCRKFCFVLALKSDEMVKSLCSGKVCIWRENIIFMKVPRGRIQQIQIAVAEKLANYMDSFYFAAVIEKITQKLTESRLNFFSVPCSPVFPVISFPLTFKSPIPAFKWGKSWIQKNLLKTRLNQSCHTELFLTRLKTALDHKTEKVKF